MHPIRRPPRRGFGEQPATLAAIQNLFARGEQGGYWPADPAYLYEDSAGTIPASVNGVVGLRFDVSRGLQNIENTTNSNNEAALFSLGTSIAPFNISRSQQSSIPGSGYYAEYVSTSNSHTYHQHSLFDAIANKTYKFSLKFYVPTGGISTFCIYDNNDGSWFGIRSSVKDQWVNVSVIRPPKATNWAYTIGNNSTDTISNGQIAFLLDDVSVIEIVGNHAIQATTANKPYLRRTPTTGKYWYDSNTATGALNVTFASALGSSCTIATVTPEGVSILENKTVGTTYNICPPYGYNSDVLIINRALTPAEKALVTRVMQRDIPAYGSLVNAIPQMRGYSANNEMQIDWSTKTSFIDYWRYGGNALTSFPLINTAAGTNFDSAWWGCSGLTSFPLINTAAGTNFYSAWHSCSGLTSFPLINTAAGTNFSYAWAYCSSLTSFPLINTAAGTNFYLAWYGCSGLTSFPLINTAAGTDFYGAWYGCSGLTSFPLINTAAGTNFDFAWYGCSSLTSFPANFFDSWTGVPIANCFLSTWYSCIKLTLSSVQNIVVSLVVSGKSAPATGTDISLDGAPTLVAIQADTTVMTAVATLKSRGWTPTYKGNAL